MKLFNEKGKMEKITFENVHVDLLVACLLLVFFCQFQNCESVKGAKTVKKVNIREAREKF